MSASIYLFFWEDNRGVDSRIFVIGKLVLYTPFTIKPFFLSFHSFHDFFDFLFFNMIVLFILLSKNENETSIFFFLLRNMLGFLATWHSIPGVKLGSLNTISRAWHRLHVFARLAQAPWFPGLDRTYVFVTPSHCFKKGTLHTYTLWPIKKSFSSHVWEQN